MNNFEHGKDPYTGLSVRDDAAKTNTLIAYGLMVAGLFTGIFWFIGAFWAMVKSSEARGTLFEDHYTNISKIFWWGLFFTIIGFITIFIVTIAAYWFARTLTKPIHALADTMKKVENSCYW